MAKNKALDEWMEWVKNLFKWLWIGLKWHLLMIVGLLGIFFLVSLYFAYKADILFNCGGNNEDIKVIMQPLVRTVAQNYLKNDGFIKIEEIQGLPYTLYSCEQSQHIECDEFRYIYTFCKPIIEQTFIKQDEDIFGVAIEKCDEHPNIVVKVTHQGQWCKTDIHIDKNKTIKYSTECRQNNRCTQGLSFKVAQNNCNIKKSTWLNN